MTVTSPPSVVKTIELPLIDFTVPRTLANVVCATAKIVNMMNKAHFEASRLRINVAFWRNFFMDSQIIIESCEGIKVGKELSNSVSKKRQMLKRRASARNKPLNHEVDASISRSAFLRAIPHRYPPRLPFERSTR